MKSSVTVYKRCRPLLGTFVEISLLGKTPDFCFQPVNDAFVAMEEISRIMSFHDPMSDLSRLNRMAVGKWIRVDHRLVEVLNLATDLQRKSHGIFNVAVGQPLVYWNFLPGKASTAGLKHLTKMGFETAGKEKVRRLLPVKIDLGGIAKGYAVDQAVKSLQKIKGLSGCVNAGGDLRVFGRLPQTVCVRTGLATSPQGRFTSIQNGSLATSEIISRKNVSPYIDILNKKSLLVEKAAVVMAPQCVIADALTKIALLSPLRLAKKIAGSYGADLRVLR